MITSLQVTWLKTYVTDSALTDGIGADDALFDSNDSTLGPFFPDPFLL
jgi:hypothetical protein